MIPRPPISTRTYTLLPYTTLVRSLRDRVTYQAQHVGCRRLRNVGAEQIRTLYRYRRGHGAAVGTADDAELRRAGDAACNQIFGNRIYIVERILLELQTPLRSEEHTSELQSLMRISYAVFCLKKKIPKIRQTYHPVINQRK